jgi:hypothetical protein
VLRRREPEALFLSERRRSKRLTSGRREHLDK